MSSNNDLQSCIFGKLFITPSESAALWETYLSHPASITMEGILICVLTIIGLLTLVLANSASDPGVDQQPAAPPEQQQPEEQPPAAPVGFGPRRPGPRVGPRGPAPQIPDVRDLG